MTLIISYADKDGGIVVSDRFTSSDGIVVNRNFNKTIHVIGLDCSLVVSFTGNASINYIPTCTKIVEFINGEKINDKYMGKSRKRPASRFRTCSHIVANIAKGFKKISKKSYYLNLEVTISGQHIYRNHLLPFFCVMKKQPKSFFVNINGSRPTDYLLDVNSHTFISGGYSQAYKSLGEVVFSQVRDARLNSCNRDELTNVLVDGVRKFADKQPFAIGRSIQVITSSFMDRKSVISFDNAKDFGPVDYTATLLNVTNPCNAPWILTPRGMSPPFTVYGSSLSYVSGDYTIEIIPSEIGNGISISHTPTR